MNSVFLSDVLAAVLSASFQTVILKVLLKHFRPDLQNNNWGSAIVVSVLSAAASLVTPWAGAIAFFLLCIAYYRTSFGVTFGIALLAGIVMSAIEFCLSLGLAIHPLLVVGVVAVCIAISLGIGARARAQRLRMQAIWNEGR